MTLKNGLVIVGKPKRLQALTLDSVRQKNRDSETLGLPFIMVENGYRPIFVPRGQVAKLDERDDLGRLETFTFRQRKTGITWRPDRCSKPARLTNKRQRTP